MYKKVDSSMNFVDREHEVIEFWNKEDIFKKSMRSHPCLVVTTSGMVFAASNHWAPMTYEA